MASSALRTTRTAPIAAGCAGAGPNRQELHLRRHRRRQRDRDLHFPRSQLIVQLPRSAFSTTSNLSGGAHCPVFAISSSISLRRRSFERSMKRFSAAMPSASRRPIGRPASTRRRAPRPAPATARPAAAPDPRAFEQLEGGADGVAPAGVGQVAERDDPDAVVGQPAHQRSEAGQAAAVRDDVARSRRSG